MVTVPRGRRRPATERRMSWIRPGSPSTGRSAAPCARAASGGSPRGISGACSPGTRCRSIRQNTWSRSGSARSRRSWALGFVSLVAIPGQIALGHLSDRIGREWAWTAGCLGFALCYLALLVLRHTPTPPLLHFMVASQGALGYALTSVIGAIPAEIFEGHHYGTIFGTLMVAAIGGGAAGPWVTSLLYDATGSYALAFWIAIGCSALSAMAIWL